MISAENLFSNLLTVGILLILGLIIYLKSTNKTLVELISDMREGFEDKTIETYEETANTFQDIR